MRRIFIALIFILLLCGCAFADEPVNPYFHEAKAPSRMKREIYGIDVEIECTQWPSYDRDTCWNVTATGGDGNYEYSFYVLDAETWEVHGYRTFMSDPGFGYRFIVPGDYDIYVEVIDGSGNAGY